MDSEYTEPVAQLLAYGDPRGEPEWPNYLSLGFTEEHVPELVKMVLDDELNRGSGETLKIWAPVHAWRTPGARWRNFKQKMQSSRCWRCLISTKISMMIGLYRSFRLFTE